MKKFYNAADAPDLHKLVAEAIELKANPLAYKHIGADKSIALMFLNPSLRTRLSSVKAARLLGMHANIFEVAREGWKLEYEDGVVMNMDKAEHIREAAPVIGQYVDIIAIRAFPSLQSEADDARDQVLNSFIKLSGRPVVNLESALFHPLQAVADLMTITELKSKPNPKIVMTWAPHPNTLPHAVPNSFAQTITQARLPLTIACPPGYELNPEYTKGASVTHNQNEALADADFVYVKNWSATQPYGKKLTDDPSWTFNNQKLMLTNNAKIMHCLPVRRNVVIADEILDGPNSVVIHEADNRTWAAMAVFKRIIEAL